MRTDATAIEQQVEDSTIPFNLQSWEAHSEAVKCLLQFGMIPIELSRKCVGLFGKTTL